MMEEEQGRLRAPFFSVHGKFPALANVGLQRESQMLKMLAIPALTLVIAAGAVPARGQALEAPKDATETTRTANAGVLRELPFANGEDFDFALRGLVEAVPGLVVKGADDRVVWSMAAYGFLKGESPASVNPSLWRNAMLNAQAGLFKVAERIYQIRGFDLSNMTLIEGDAGIIVIDPLLTIEPAKAGLELYFKHRPRRPVVAVIYTHSHADHFGGVRGVIDEDDVRSGKVKVIAPQGFMDHAISENVIAGNAMSRRAAYMYGSLIPKSPRGQVDAGIGKTISTGSLTLIPPTDSVTKTGQEMTIDGVRIVFQVTPNTEAPSEMNFHFPQFRALCLAENANGSLHNLYTLRGAQVRDARAWAFYLNEALRLYGDQADVVFTSHFFPRYGRSRIAEFVTKQADAYKYIHDQTLRLANHGYTMNEIAGMVKLPKSLALEWFNRDYYGTVNHNSKAVYQRYLGWFDGNPAHLDPLPPEEAGKKYVEFMGGADAVMAKAQIAFDKGEYRWVAEVMNHVVFAEPENAKARGLAADALEQLGYQSESSAWRNFYLTGASELRNGVRKGPALSAGSPDMVRGLSLDEFFAYLGVRLNGPKAEGRNLALNFRFTDTGQQYAMVLRNSVLNATADAQLKDADASITLTRALLDEVTLRRATFEEKIKAGEVKVEGDPRKLGELFALLDSFDFWFNIVTP
jgi:alkyl sulfatase BDS1-like metallo-beta-lactamase superfamily hydrolase